MKGLLQIPAGMLVSLLPREYRMRWAWASEGNSRRATILSGIAEAMICLLLVIIRYFTFMEWRMATIYDAAIKAGKGAAMAGEAVAFGSGFASMVEYIFRPLTMLLIYFTVEGTLRVFAAVAAEESVGTLPLYLVAWAGERAQMWRKERAVGPRVLDLVQPCEGISYDLCIATCRPKRDWNRLTTIEYQDQLYELFDEKLGVPPRRYIYMLRKLPTGKVIRGLHHYQPDEALTEKQRKELEKDAAVKEAK